MTEGRPEIWRFEDTGHRPGVFNMAEDEALAQRLLDESGEPTLRLYGWSPPAISLGWNQSPDEIDPARASAAGIDVVRRPTGGRAILHADELTYCVVMRVRSRNVLSVYDEISRALVHGLGLLGADVGIERAQPHFPSLYREASAVACFSSSARFEIKHRGRKLVGSAQRRYAVPDGSEVVLQHGSILLGPDHLRMTDLLAGLTDEQRRALRMELAERTTDLSAVLGRRVSYHEAAAAVRRGFEERWGVNFRDRAAAQPMEIHP
jgi:lipoate-protein ligase A